MAYAELVILLALIEYLFFVIMVGKARGKYGIKAPATSGNEMFERYLRVQQNTLEQLIIFIPATYLFAIYVHSAAAAIIGSFYLLGRLLYFRAYINEPAARGTGMLLGMVASLILLIGAVIGIIRTLF